MSHEFKTISSPAVLDIRKRFFSATRSGLAVLADVRHVREKIWRERSRLGFGVDARRFVDAGTVARFEIQPTHVGAESRFRGKTFNFQRN